MALIPRSVFGDFGGGVSGLKCSLLGVNALTADDQDPDLFSFNSEWDDVLRVADTGFVACGNLETGDKSVNYAHGLGFVPFIDLRLMRDDAPVIYNIRNDWARTITGGIIERYRATIRADTNSTSATFHAMQHNAIDPGFDPPAWVWQPLTSSYFAYALYQLEVDP